MIDVSDSRFSASTKTKILNKQHGENWAIIQPQRLSHLILGHKRTDEALPVRFVGASLPQIERPALWEIHLAGNRSSFHSMGVCSCFFGEMSDDEKAAEARKAAEKEAKEGQKVHPLAFTCLLHLSALSQETKKAKKQEKKVPPFLHTSIRTQGEQRCRDDVTRMTERGPERGETKALHVKQSVFLRLGAL